MFIVFVKVIRIYVVIFCLYIIKNENYFSLSEIYELCSLMVYIGFRIFGFIICICYLFNIF